MAGFPSSNHYSDNLKLCKVKKKNVLSLFFKRLFLLMSVILLPGPTDIREPSEALVRRDGNQYGAEDSRNAGQCKESQGKCY